MDARTVKTVKRVFINLAKTSICHAVSVAPRSARHVAIAQVLHFSTMMQSLDSELRETQLRMTNLFYKHALRQLRNT
jgi:hypothetical protein